MGFAAGESCKMPIVDQDPCNSTLVGGKSQVMTAVIGVVAEREFESARASISGVADYLNYWDWFDAREGLQIGLSLAGVDAATVCVGVSSFLQWRDLTGASSDERALDAFAALASTVRGEDALRVVAVVSAFDFATHPLQVAAFAGRRDYRGGARHRRATRAKAIAAGLHVEEMPVRLGGFAQWCACLRQSASEAALDRYAQLLLEHLTSDLAG